MTRRRGATWLLLSAAAAVFAALVALTGGIDTRIAGIPVRSRSWERPASVAALLASVGLISNRRAVAVFLMDVVAAARSATPRVASHVTMIAACWAGVAAMLFGSHVAGGADSYGYVSQAQLFARGQLTETLPATGAFSWPDVSYTLAPLGYKAGIDPHTIVPTYPPGLPMLMAPFARVHPDGVFIVVPLCAAAAVFFCFRLGEQLGDALAGRLAAMLLAVSPTFLYQSVQPMSDVPVTAFWLAALVFAASPARWSPAVAGAATSVAILIRPNLAPLAALVAAATAARSHDAGFRRALVCCAAIVPGLIVLGAIQYARYGSPLASGYGSLLYLFSLDNIGPNLARYPRWLTETHTVFIWLWLFAPIWILRAAPHVRTLAWIGYVFAAAVIAAYLPYAYFQPDESFYTRFLLPAIPLFLLLGMFVLFIAADRLVPLLGRRLVIVVAIGLTGVFVVRSIRVGAFEVRSGERKYPAVGTFVREQLPATAFVLAMQHSGSIRYYSGRHTLRWDLLDRAALGRAIASLHAAGYAPFAVLDPDENVDFRKRFASASLEVIDGMTMVGSVGETRIYAFR